VATVLCGDFTSWLHAAGYPESSWVGQNIILRPR